MRRSFPLTRVVATPTGGSRFVEARLPLDPHGAVGRLSAAAPAGAVRFRETDDDYDWDFHPAPARQLILLLDGEIEVTCTDRDAAGRPAGPPDVRRLGPGEVLLVEDVAGHGHATRQLSAGPRRSVFVTLSPEALRDVDDA